MPFPLDRRSGRHAPAIRRLVPLLVLCIVLPGAGRPVLPAGTTAGFPTIRASLWAPPFLRPPVQPGTGTAGVPPRLTYYRTLRGDTYWSIARRHGLDLQALIKANFWFTPARLPAGVYLRLPPARSTPGPARERRPRLSWPVGGRITSRYGWRWGRMHRGIDISARAGSVVHAAAAGRVVFAGWRSGYGLLVIIAHDQGWRTSYAHNSLLFVRAGQRVAAGAALASAGATGNATGVHVHFEVRTPDGPVDPLKMLP